MLGNRMTDMLNEQVANEFFSANLYLQMSAWCLSKGLEGSAEFMRAQADEEREHMMRIFDYINETGGVAILGAIPAPPTEWTNVHEVFEKAFEHEQGITLAINTLVAAAFEEKDFSSFDFLQWYVAEQHEEENLFKGILDKAVLIGMEGRGMYHFDNEVKKILKQQAAVAPAG